MTTEGVIVFKKPNELIPDEYLQKALQKNTHSAVTLVTENGALAGGNTSNPETLETVKETQQSFRKLGITYYFLSSPNKITEDAMQPYTLLTDEEGKGILVAYLAGKFSGFDRKDSSHPATFHLVNEILRPQIAKIYRLTKFDLEETLEELKNPQTSNELFLSNMVEGSVALLASDMAAPITIDKTEKKRDFPWGWVSDTLGYQPDTSYPAKEETPKASGLMGKLKLPGMKAPEMPKAPTIPAPPKTDTAPPPSDGEMIGPPNEMHSKNQIKKWYRDNLGFLPNGYMLKPKFAKSSLKPKTIHGLEGLKQFGTSKSADVPAVAPSEKPADNAITEPVKSPEAFKQAPKVEEQEEAKTPEPTAQEQEIMPIISAQEAEAILEDFMKRSTVVKALDRASQEVPDPKEFQAMEERIATFVDKMGLTDLSELYYLPYEDCLFLAQKYPTASAVLIRNALTRCIELQVKAPVQQRPAATASLKAKLPTLKLPDRRAM